MKMERRDFLKLLGMGGAGAALSLPGMQVLAAATDNYSGPLWLFINATGGWDPTSLWDPKGYTDINDPLRVNNYARTAIAQVAGSPLRYAPPPDNISTAGLYSAKTFYDKYYQKMLVINGVDTRTNSHDDGQRYNWSGELGRAGFPSIGALIAGSAAPVRPLSYMTNGGYSLTGGLTVAARLNTSGLASLYEIAFPNRSQTASSPASRLYFPESGANTRQLIMDTRDARTQALLDAQHLVRVKDAISKLQASRSGPGRLSTMADNLAAYVPAPPAGFSGRTNAYSLYQQGHIALAAYESGVASTAQLSVGGFDTHANHDANHYPRLMDLLQGLDAILTEAKNRGLAERIVLMVGSDFGRTNQYNADAGKDHWPITSMMMMGNATQQIRGNRMLGATTDDHRALWLNPTTLAAVPANTSGAVRLTPGVIHLSLRRLAGVDTSLAASSTFRLTDQQSLNLFA
jgi:uncharacterized protein (DUF1501 family)